MEYSFDRSPGAVQIVTERMRQSSRSQHGEGFTPEHDDAYVDCSLVLAAQAYAEAARRQVLGGDAVEVGSVARYWPWDAKWFKVDDDPMRNLAKAGALIAAEIDRLQRLAAKKGAA